MKTIGVIVAMQKELDLYLSNMEEYNVRVFNHRAYYMCKHRNFNVAIAVSGIGKVAAALTASNMILSFSPDLVINIGVSGGLDKSLHIGDWVIGKDLCYHDFYCDVEIGSQDDPNIPHIYHSDWEIASKQIWCTKGLLCSGDQFITDPQEIAALKEQYPHALAVDMESAAIAQTCELYETKFLCLRQISDVPGVENHEEQYKKFWENASSHSYSVFKSVLDSL